MCCVKYIYHRFCRTILTTRCATGWSNPLPLTEPGSDSRRATIRDVAALAGVSIGTASKALNGQGKLRAETRERVAAAAAELGFTPNVLARGLLAGRTYTVGLITTDSFGRFSIPVMLGAENALGAGQISVFMCDTRDDPARERHYVDMLLRRQVDGLIVTGRRIEPRPSIGTALGIPVVYAMTQSLDSDEPAILPDDHGGGALAARHFVATGRRKVGHITGPERFLCARKRAAGFWSAVTEGGLEFKPSDVLYGEWSERWGRQAAEILLRNHPDVDAIFCGSDQLARGVSDTLRAMGRRDPRRHRADRLRQLGADGAGRPARAGQRGHVPGGRGADRRRAPAVGHRRPADARRPRRAVPAGAPGLGRPRDHDDGRRERPGRERPDRGLGAGRPATP